MRVATAVTLSSLLCVACGPSWPSSALTIKAPKPSHPIATVDVLPLDLEMWAEAGYELNPEELRGRAEASLTNAALDALVKHAYSPNALIDWNGNYAGGGTALPKEALLATVGSLAHYGEGAHDGQLPVPYLPAHLGDVTQGDATLYIGGWSYLAVERESTANTVAKDVVIGIIVVATAALILGALGATDHKGSHHDHGGGGGGHEHDGASGGTVSHWHGHSDDHALARATAETAIDLVDAFGHAAIATNESHPEYADDPNLPHAGEEPRMYLEMTLVDNHTGLALWHAHQTFPANGASQEDVSRAANTLLATLPAS